MLVRDLLIALFGKIIITRSKMSTSAQYVWQFDLSELNVDDSSTNSYYAHVKYLNSYSVSDIASAIEADRTDLRRQTIETVVNLFNEKAMQKVCMGGIVNTGLAVLRPTIRGKFIGTTGQVTDDISPYIVINSTRSLKDELSEVKLKYTGNVLTTGGSMIGSVSTSESGDLAGVIYPGQFVVIKGRYIKCIDATGQGNGVISFVSLTTAESFETSIFAHNGINKVIATVPRDLPSDNYKLMLTTFYNRSGIPLKNARILEYSKTLIVE